MHAHGHGLDIRLQAATARRFPGVADVEPAGADDVGEDVAGHQLAVLQHYAHLAAHRAQVHVLMSKRSAVCLRPVTAPIPVSSLRTRLSCGELEAPRTKV